MTHNGVEKVLRHGRWRKRRMYGHQETVLAEQFATRWS
jgi:hypothetical protein